MLWESQWEDLSQPSSTQAPQTSFENVQHKFCRTGEQISYEKYNNSTLQAQDVYLE